MSLFKAIINSLEGNRIAYMRFKNILCYFCGRELYSVWIDMQSEFVVRSSFLFYLESVACKRVKSIKTRKKFKKKELFSKIDRNLK